MAKECIHLLPLAVQDWSKLTSGDLFRATVDAGLGGLGMSGKPSIPERVAGFIFSESSLQAFWTYVFPPLLGVATAGAGIVEHQPIMWVMATGAISFAMASVGLLAFYQWRFRRTPEHKVIFGRIMINRSPADSGKNEVGMGFVMKNTADFPVEVTLTKLNYSLASRIPTKPLTLNTSIKVDAFIEFYFTGGVIDITGVTDEDMSGEIEFSFQYGRPGGRMYTVSRAQNLSVPRDVKKPFVNSEKLLGGEQVGQAG